MPEKPIDNNPNQSTALEYSNYVNNSSYKTVREGRIQNFEQTDATPTSITISYIPTGNPVSIVFTLTNYDNPQEIHTFTTTNPNFTFTGLTPNSSYKVNDVSTFNSTSTFSLNTNKIIQTLNEGPATNISISNIKNKSAILRFDNPLGKNTLNNTKLIISNKKDTTDKQTIPDIISPYTIPNLRINSEYNIQLITSYKITNNTYVASLASSFMTLNEDTPTNFIITKITNKTATITYRYTGKPARNIIAVENTNVPTDIYSPIHTLSNIVILPLKINQTYSISITSRYSSGNNYTYTYPNTFTTLLQDKIADIFIQSIRGDSVSFSFSPSPGTPSYYDIYITNPILPQEKYYLQTTNTKSISMSDLSFNTNYILTISSVYSDGYIYDNSTNIQTLNEGRISKIQIQEIGNTFFSFNIFNTFTIPDTLYYNVIIQNINSTINNIVSDYPNNTNTITIQYLNINAIYSITINSIFKSTQNKYSYIHPNTVNTINQGPATITSVYNITTNTIKISFKNDYGTLTIPYSNLYTFNLFLQDTNNTTTTIPFVPNNTTPFLLDVSNLIPNMNYTIDILTTYSASPNYSYYLPIKSTVSTKMYPSQISYTNITSSSIVIQYLTPFFQPTTVFLLEKYTSSSLTILKTNSFVPNNIPNNNGFSSISVNDLVGNTEYILTLRFYYSDINTNYDTSFNISTKGSVQNVQINQITNNSSILQFSSPLVLPTTTNPYTIYLLYNSNIIRTVFTTNTTHPFSDLSANTNYSAEIISNYTDQSYNTFISWNTKDSPRNMNFTNITTNSMVLTFDTLLYIPNNYILQYNNTFLTIPAADIYVNSQNQFEYVWSTGLTPDTSYNNIQLTSHYDDIPDNYISSIYSQVIYTKGFPIGIYFDTIDISSAVIHFQVPTYTIPNSYILNIQSIHSSPLENTSFQQTFTTNIINGAVVSYTITRLNENTAYSVVANAYYSSTQASYNNNTTFSFYTHGRAVIQSISGIYDTYATLSWIPLLEIPNTYTVKFTSYPELNEYPITFSTSQSSYTVLPPYSLNANKTYTVSLSANYSNTEIYTNNFANAFTTKGYISIFSNAFAFLITDTSANISFQLPTILPNSVSFQLFLLDRNNVQIQQEQQSNNVIYQTTNNNITNYSYFVVSGLTQNTSYKILLKGYYLDIMNSIYRDNVSSYIFKTNGPPTDLSFNSKTNTQIEITFNPPYNCNTYIIQTTNITSGIVNPPIYYQNISINLITYTIKNLLENTRYSIYVQSYYPATNNTFSCINPSSVNTTTFSGLQINRFQNITDVSMVSIVDISNNNANKYSYFLQTDNVNDNGKSVSISVPTTLQAGYYNIQITELTANTNYTSFYIQEEFLGSSFGNGITNGIILTSNNKPFQTLGLSTNISTYITDISATIIFPTPLVSPSAYYYAYYNPTTTTISTYYNIPLTSFKSDTNNNTIQFDISELNTNTNYSLYLFTDYNTGISKIKSNLISFITKQYPIITSTISGDTFITVSFNNILANVSSYSYSIMQLYGTLKTVSFQKNNFQTVNITGLIPNTYYPQLTINTYYRDISATYTSSNLPFYTNSRPLNPSINNSTLSFYSPINKPTAYIITNPNDTPNPKTINTDSMTNSNNQYFYNLLGISDIYKYAGINIQSVYNNQIIPALNLQINPNSNLIINFGLVDLATNSTGQYILCCESSTIYISRDYGNTWITKNNNTIINKVAIDDSGKNQYAINTGKPAYYYISNDYGNTWIQNKLDTKYLISSISTDSSGQSIFIGGSSGSNNLFSSDFGKTFVSDSTINNSTYSIFTDSFIYSIDSTTNNVFQIDPKRFTINSIFFPSGLGLVPKYICANRANTRFIVVGTNFASNSAKIYLSSYNSSTATWTWTESMLSSLPYSNVVWNSLSCNSECIIAIIVVNGVGVFMTNDAGYHWNIIIPTNNLIKNAVISRNNKYVYAYDTNRKFYYYSIPDTQGAVYFVNVSNITNNSFVLSGFSPSYIPDLGYDISAVNAFSPYDIKSVNSSTIQNVLIDGLVPDGSYNIRITTRYLYPPLTFVSTPISTYTKNMPLNVAIQGNPTDISAVIQFTPPKFYPDNFILDAYTSLPYTGNGVKHLILNPITDIYTNNGFSCYLLSGLQQNQNYTVFISSSYNDNGTIYKSDTFANFYTRGPPTNITFTNVKDTTVDISFIAPFNIIDTATIKYIINVSNIATSSSEDYYSPNNQSTITDLTINSVYNIFVSTNYINPVQSIKSVVVPLYTRSAPLNLSILPDYITDVSAILQFNSPAQIPNSYILNVRGVTTSFLLSDTRILSTIDTSAVIITGLIPNTNYISDISFSSYYASSNITIPKIVPEFQTEGSLSNINVALDANNNATITFTPPINTRNVRYYFIVKNTTNSINTTIYDSSQNNTEPARITIQNTVSDTKILSNNRFQIINSTIYPNHTIIGTTKDFISRSGPLDFRMDSTQIITDTSMVILFGTPLNLPDKYRLHITNTSVSPNTTVPVDISNDKTLHIITNLIPNTLYTLDLKSVYGSDEISSGNIINTQTLGPVRNRTISSITNTSFIVNFQNSYTFPNTYNISVENQNNSTDISQNRFGITPIDANNYSYTFDNLLQNNTYKITITSFFTGITLSTNVIQSTQGEPTNIQIPDLILFNTDSRIVYFTRAKYTPIEYIYRLTNNANTNVLEDNISSEISNFMLYSLIPNTNYTIQISSIYIDVSYSSSTSFYTNGNVRNLSIAPSSITDVSAVVSFQNPYNLPVYSYVLDIQNINPLIPLDTFSSNITVNNTNNYTYNEVVSGLTTNNTYRATIKSYFIGSMLDTSITFSTESAPTNFAVSNIQDISATIALTACTYIPTSYHLLIQYNTINDIDYFIQDNTIPIDYSFQDITVNPPVNNSFSFIYDKLVADVSYTLTLYSYYASTQKKYYTSPISITTLSAPTNITVKKTLITANISYTPPRYTIPTDYTILITDINGVRFNDAGPDNPATITNDISYTFTGLVRDSAYYAIISSNYSNPVYTISTPPFLFYTINKPIISSLFYYKNLVNGTYTIKVNYSVVDPPLYYLLRIQYPDSTTIKQYDADSNNLVYYFVNLTQIGIYYINATAVYEGGLTSISDPSTNILVSSTEPVILNSVLSAVDTSSNILVNYTIRDTTLNYNLNIVNTTYSTIAPIISPLSISQNQVEYNGLFFNSGTYRIYISTYSTSISGGFQTNYISYTLSSVLTFNINSFSTDISSVVVNYSIQPSFNTTYTLYLENVYFPELSYNMIIYPQNKSSSRFTDLYYNSGSYNSYILLNYYGNISNSTTKTSDVLKFFNPFNITTVSGLNNTISLQYTVYNINTYKSRNYFFIESQAYPEISYNILVPRTSTNYVLNTIEYYNLGYFNLYIDVLNTSGKYREAYNANPIYVSPIIPFTFGNISFNVQTNTITVPFTISRTYKPTYTLTAKSRLFPELLYTAPSITSSSTSATFILPYYNTGTYDICMSLVYSGVNSPYNTSQSITVTNKNPITFGTITSDPSNINVAFQLLPVYNSTYTITATNVFSSTIRYSQTVNSTDTSWNFTGLNYVGVGSYNGIPYNDEYIITMSVSSINNPSSNYSINTPSPYGVKPTAQLAVFTYPPYIVFGSVLIYYNLKPVTNGIYTITITNTTTNVSKTEELKEINVNANISFILEAGTYTPTISIKYGPIISVRLYTYSITGNPFTIQSGPVCTIQ